MGAGCGGGHDRRLLQTSRAGVACRAPERDHQCVVPAGRMGGMGLGQTRGRARRGSGCWSCSMSRFLLFIVWYIWLYTRIILDVNPPIAIATVVVFLAATVLALRYSSVLHGALVYMPGLLVVLVLGVAHTREQRVERFTLLVAAKSVATSADVQSSGSSGSASG